MNIIKQVIIVRKDLSMRRGKEIAQGSHASMKVFFDKILNDLTYQCGDSHTDIITRLTPEMVSWMNGSFTKVVVSCDSEEELFELQKQAEEAGIVNALILDNGNTEFKDNCQICGGSGLISKGKNPFCLECNGSGKVSKPTYTSLAIGPDYSEKIDPITGHLKLR